MLCTSAGIGIGIVGDGGGQSIRRSQQEEHKGQKIRLPRGEQETQDQGKKEKLIVVVVVVVVVVVLFSRLPQWRLQH